MKSLAGFVSIETQDDFWLGGFVDDPFNPTEYFMLQRAFEFDEQDIELGIDTYHFEIGDQGCSSYGGIERFELGRNVAHIEFHHRTALELEIESSFEIWFVLTPDEWNELKTFLENIFLNTNILELQV